MTVAVAHDDSPEGRAALLRAAQEAEFLQTSLAVLHVWSGAELSGAASGGPSAEEQLLRQGVDLLLSEHGHGQLSWALHTAGDELGRAAALVGLVEDVQAELLVVGSRRRTPIGKFLLGSTVQRVVLDSPVPVLVVKAADVDVARPSGLR